MVKILAFLKRKDGLSLEEFSRHWAGHHGPLVARIAPEIRRYVQNHQVAPAPDGGEPPYDGVSEVWYDDLASCQATFARLAGPDGKPIRDDERRFLDRSKMVFFLVEERVIKA
ncbi:MAG: EthD domain-containing protein [Candidatus Binatia bacterium]